MRISVRLLPALTLLLAASTASAQGGDSSPGPRPLDTQPGPRLQTFEPIYFIGGTRKEETTAKVQLSFKVSVFDEGGLVGKPVPPLATLHFGYTQTAVWSLSEESKPFKDTSYKPSVFYLEPAAWTSTDKLHNLALEGGYQHESNGKSGPSSRSIDILYVRPEWRSVLDDGRFLLIAPKLWGYLDKDDNPDIQRYRGYFDLNLRAGYVDRLHVSTNYRKGTATAGAVQVDVSYPLGRPESGRPWAYLLLQYFGGYGETLLEYNAKGPAQLRVGLAVVR